MVMKGEIILRMALCRMELLGCSSIKDSKCPQQA